jgi:hypothetical protein
LEERALTCFTREEISSLNIFQRLKGKLHTEPCLSSPRENGVWPVAYSGIFFREGSTNSVEGRENGSGGCSPIVRGSAQFANE